MQKFLPTHSLSYVTDLLFHCWIFCLKSYTFQQNELIRKLTVHWRGPKIAHHHSSHSIIDTLSTFNHFIPFSFQMRIIKMKMTQVKGLIKRAKPLSFKTLELRKSWTNLVLLFEWNLKVCSWLLQHNTSVIKSQWCISLRSQISGKNCI